MISEVSSVGEAVPLYFEQFQVVQVASPCELPAGKSNSTTLPISPQSQREALPHCLECPAYVPNPKF